jgi:hypothetical protein
MSLDVHRAAPYRRHGVGVDKASYACSRYREEETIAALPLKWVSSSMRKAAVA